MRSADPRQLAEQAEHAAQADDPAAAAEALEALCEIEPDEPRHWKQLGRCYQQLGRTLEAIAALVRAAGRYTDRGDGIQAIAICRWILELDPTHTATIDRLARLQQQAGMPPADLERMPAPGAVPRRPGAPLDDVLRGEQVAPSAPADHEGCREIPLDTPVPPVVGDATDASPSIAGPATASAHPVRERPDEKRAVRGLVATPLFGRLGASALRRLIESTRLVRLAEGAVLFREGDAADALYVVVEGAVVPIAEGPPRQRLTVLEPGDFFGEIALVTDEPRNATVEALVESELLAIDRAAVRALLATEPEVLAVLLRFLRERLVTRMLLTSPLFEDVDRDECARLVRAFRLVELKRGTCLVEQGAPARALFVVLAGALRVVRSDDGVAKTLAVIGAGEPCGEMSLLDVAPAVADVVADRKSWVLRLERSEFDRVVRAHPTLGPRLAAIADDRRGAA